MFIVIYEIWFSIIFKCWFSFLIFYETQKYCLNFYTVSLQCQLLLLKALKQLVWILPLRWKNALDWKICFISIFPKMFAHINMFYQHYLGNKKPNFLACNPEKVYAIILEFSKSNDLFQNHQTYSRRILEISLNFLNMVPVRLEM